jgi:hypothetical protein
VDFVGPVQGHYQVGFVQPELGQVPHEIVLVHKTRDPCVDHSDRLATNLFAEVGVRVHQLFHDVRDGPPVRNFVVITNLVGRWDRAPSVDNRTTGYNHPVFVLGLFQWNFIKIFETLIIDVFIRIAEPGVANSHEPWCGLISELRSNLLGALPSRIHVTALVRLA